MENILLPSKIEFQPDKENKNRAILTVEPCYPGYGVTLGNALRRVLLSSLPGAAVTAVKIKDALHEFSTIPGVKEDVLDIVLNLKQLRLKIFSDEPVVLSLEVKGEKKVKAEDFTKNSLAEIANPDLEIATLTDKKAKFEMQVWAEKGIGYVSVEERRDKNLEVGVILVDSIFSPIKNVGFQVENVRVGERTDYDKLILNIETDGTFTPKQAVSEATKILIEQFGLFVEPEESKVSEVSEVNKVSIEKVEEKKTEEIKEEEVKKEEKKEEEPKKRKRGRPKKVQS